MRIHHLSSALALLALLLAACPSSSPKKSADTTPEAETTDQPTEVTGSIDDDTDSEPETAEPDYQSLEMGSADNIVPALKLGAERADCKLVAAEGQDITVTCEEDTLFIRQRGAELQWACQSLDGDPCRQLLMVIVDAAVGATDQ